MDDTVACQADVVEESLIAELCPTEWKAFNDSIESSGTSLQTVAKAVKFEDESSWEHELASNIELHGDERIDGPAITWITQKGRAAQIIACYKALRLAFRRATMTGKDGLDLCLNEKDDGPRGDEIEDGPFWHVEGVWALTSAGRRFIDRIRTNQGYTVSC